MTLDCTNVNTYRQQPVSNPQIACFKITNNSRNSPVSIYLYSLFFSLPKATISENKEKIKVSSSMAISDDCSTEEDW